MGLTGNTATALLALNGLEVLPNSAVSVAGAEAGLVGSGQRIAVLAPSGSQVLYAEAAGASALRAALEDLPWQDLEDLPADLKRRYLDRAFEADRREVRFDDLSLARAAVKYGAAVAHVARLYCHLQAAMGEDFEVEVPVDETESPTTHAQHVSIAMELRRLGVK
jgi:hypothetical protein